MEKGICSRLGGRYDPESKKWDVPAGTDMVRFRQCGCRRTRGMTRPARCTTRGWWLHSGRGRRQRRLGGGSRSSRTRAEGWYKAKGTWFVPETRQMALSGPQPASTFCPSSTTCEYFLPQLHYLRVLSLTGSPPATRTPRAPRSGFPSAKHAANAHFLLVFTSVPRQTNNPSPCGVERR